MDDIDDIELKVLVCIECMVNTGNRNRQFRTKRELDNDIHSQTPGLQNGEPIINGWSITSRIDPFSLLYFYW